VTVLLRRGVQGTQVSNIVREAGVSRGTFYRHFDSKRHLLGAAARELLDRILPRFPKPPPLSTRRDLESALSTMHRQALSAALAERDSARLILSGGAAAEPAAARWMASHEESWRRLVSTLLARARTARLLRDDVDPALATSVVVGGVQHVLRSAVLGRGGDRDGATLAADLARLQVDGLSPQ
jgi:AcrR family transcriptional regulator